MIDTKKHQIVPADAERIADWLKNRGGLFIWGCLDLGSAGRTWTTPATNADGTPVTKPHWSASNTPIRHITDIADVEVCHDKEVKRFRVGLKRGSGFRIDVSDAGSAKIKREVAKAGDGAYHEFDYETQEAVIMAPDKVVPLSEWNPSPVSE